MEVVQEEVLIQKLNKVFPSKLEKAITYYALINALNNLKLTRKQIELLAFTSIRGTISSPTAKLEFIRIFGSSVDSINNMISKLYKKKLLVKSKVDNKIRVPKVICPDFATSEIILSIKIGDNGQEFK